VLNIGRGVSSYGLPPFIAMIKEENVINNIKKSDISSSIHELSDKNLNNLNTPKKDENHNNKINEASFFFINTEVNETNISIVIENKTSKNNEKMNIFYEFFILFFFFFIFFIWLEV
jgi:ATP-dependent Zn protease